MNKYILKQEVLDAYDGYVKAFIKGCLLYTSDAADD